LSILALVGEKQVPLAEEAVVQGAKGFLVRPFSNEELCAKVEEIALQQPAMEEPPSAETFHDAVRTGRNYEKLPFLFRLPSNVMGSLLSGSPVDRYAPGAVIVKPGDLVESLRILTGGEVEIRSSTDADSEIRGSGECIAERAFVCGQPSQVVVTARTSVTTVAVSKEAMADLARRIPAVMDVLCSLLAPRGADEAEGASEIVGSLSSLSFPELLQHLTAARKTGVLILEDGERSGRIYLERGNVTDALADGERGERVFRRLAGWLKARFEFKVGSATASRTITRPTLSLLMELLPQAHEAGAAAV
jgi:CRP-like cAMP-binding protein